MNADNAHNETRDPLQAHQSSRQLRTGMPNLPNLELVAIIGILGRQWLLIVVIFILTILAALGLLSQLRAYYTAEALLVIDDNQTQLIGVGDTLGIGTGLNHQVDTEVEIINSSSVALGVIDRLALWRDDEFGFDSRSLLQDWLSLAGWRQEPREIPAASRVSDLVGDQQAQLVIKLDKAVTVFRHRTTNVISIQATSKDPQKSALIANTMVDSYLDIQISAHARTAQRAAVFLRTRVDQLAEAIQNADGKIDAFIIDQSGKVGTPEAQAQLQRMKDQAKAIGSRQSSLAVELAQLQSIGSNPRKISIGSVTGELRVIAEQRAALVRAAEAAPVPDLDAQLQAIDAKFVEAASKRSNSIRDQLQKSDTEKEALRAQLQDLFSRQQIPSDVAVGLYRLQKDTENNRRLYDIYSSKLSEVGQRMSLALPNSRIVAQAITPSRPSFPPSILILAIAAVFGLGLGASAAGARELLVGGFATPEQVEAVIGLPVIADVPRLRDAKPSDEILREPFSSYSESIRRLRVGIESRLASTGVNPAASKVVLFTSTESDEGKTTLAISLARASAAMGRKVLLMDCDLRHPAVDKMLGAASGKDIIEVILTLAPGEDLATYAELEGSAGPYYITAAAAKLPSDSVFGSIQFVNLLQAARRSFDLVILDMPPISYVIDPKIVSGIADACLYVVRQNFASQREIISGVKQMLDSPNPIPVFIVMNNTREALASLYFKRSKYGKYNKYFRSAG